MRCYHRQILQMSSFFTSRTIFHFSEPTYKLYEFQTQFKATTSIDISIKIKKFPIISTINNCQTTKTKYRSFINYKKYNIYQVFFEQVKKRKKNIIFVTTLFSIFKAFPLLYRNFFFYVLALKEKISRAHALISDKIHANRENILYNN